MSYLGTIIEESLSDNSVLAKVKVLSTKIDGVNEKHKTPWLRRWTLHKIEIPDDRAQVVADMISKSLDYTHGSSWYADYKNPEYHYIIFKDKVFKVSRNNEAAYQEVRNYGISLGIPEYQVDFSPDIK